MHAKLTWITKFEKLQNDNLFHLWWLVLFAVYSRNNRLPYNPSQGRNYTPKVTSVKSECLKNTPKQLFTCCSCFILRNFPALSYLLFFSPSSSSSLESPLWGRDCSSSCVKIRCQPQKHLTWTSMMSHKVTTPLDQTRCEDRLNNKPAWEVDWVRAKNIYCDMGICCYLYHGHCYIHNLPAELGHRRYVYYITNLITRL